jgi:hypothetical protein
MLTLQSLVSFVSGSSFFTLSMNARKLAGSSFSTTLT